MSQAKAQLQRIEVPRTARYWVLDPTGGSHKGTLYVLHGYGQLAQYFIRKFQTAADAGWRVIAPEGTHRFYLQGFSGRVGASWMTKEDRITDISDYVRYLDLLRKEQMESEDPLPQVLLGFSQGVATAFRWLALGEGGPESWQGIIAHSGIIPPDLPNQRDLLTQAPPLQLIAGTEDAFIDSLNAGFATSETEWSKLGGSLDTSSRHTYPGGHDIDIASTLAALGRIG